MSKQKLELTWIGKDKQPVLEPRILIEDSEKSYGDKSSENMLIFGDNLLALKALEQDFAGKIKCAAIDPPYNTGKVIVNELMNFPEIDYDVFADLLFKLAGQAVEKCKTYLDEEQMINVVQYNKKEIGQYIYAQMMEHFYCETPDFQKPVVRPFTRIEEHNFSKYTKDSIHHYTDTITPTNAIPGKVFSGFTKACHNLYKFDSKTEKDFAYILEQDKAVLKWLRPAGNQFHIYWKHNSRRYCPDFVAETTDAIYMVETKKEDEMEAAEVQEKAHAALIYCRHANDFTSQNGGKAWKYVLIPHDVVKMNMGFDTLAKHFIQ